MGLTENPVFVVGSPRSGTTVMRSIIDAHPNIFCPPWETGLFVHFDGILHHHERTYLERDELVAWTRCCAEQLLERFAAKTRTPKTRWAEKTPAHVRHIELIHEVFPKAQFVHMIRNGYEVVRSLQNMPFAPRNVRWNTRTWVDSVHAGRKAGELLPAHLYKEIRYEQLLENPRSVLEDLCGFLGEPFSESMLQFDDPEKNSWRMRLGPLQGNPVNSYRELPVWSRLAFRWLAEPLMSELNYRIKLA